MEFPEFPELPDFWFLTAVVGSAILVIVILRFKNNRDHASWHRRR